MLHIITGKAGAGKTDAMMQSIAENVRAEKKSFLIVPEQYSHQAERELCKACGDTAALYAEVMSFTGLARWTDRQLGCGEPVVLDQGGQLLCMALAIEAVCTQLRVYGHARKRVNLQSQLLEAVQELKTACITPEELLETAEACQGPLHDKLYDLAMIQGARSYSLSCRGPWQASAVSSSSSGVMQAVFSSCTASRSWLCKLTRFRA